ncbi:MAG: sodium-dependent transporter, partial [Bacteroidota bacterium]
PVAYAIDEHNLPRKKAAWYIGLGILAISILISFKTSLIGTFNTIFNNVGLPLGGVLICLFVGLVWKTRSALDEMELGFEGIKDTLFAKLWPVFIWVICPAAIIYNLGQTLYALLF